MQPMPDALNLTTLEEYLLQLIERAQEFVGTRTSKEQGESQHLHAVYLAPVSEGDRLRIEADKADRRDQLIIELREAIAKPPRGEDELVVHGPAFVNLVEAAKGLRRGCDCELDYRCGACQAVINTLKAAEEFVL